MTGRLTRWTLTSPWLRVPPGATRVRMVYRGRWSIQVPKGVKVYGGPAGVEVPEVEEY